MTVFLLMGDNHSLLVLLINRRGIKMKKKTTILISSLLAFTRDLFRRD